MENNLVRYSRAGDVFHYRWAARRCLRLIYPNSSLKTITIEGSKEPSTGGEYVIDVAEYSSYIEKEEKINYYQLKHTTVRLDKPFILSDLKDTFEGFSARFKDLYLSHLSKETKSIVFTLLTNRPVADIVKHNISKIQDSLDVDARFKSTLEKYTGLSDTELRTFCSLLVFEDGEGDYNGQKYELHLEIDQILAGIVDTPQVDSIIALVQEKALPDSNRKIEREDILKRFGIYSEKQLYPAPPIWEPLSPLIERNNTENTRKAILLSDGPIIVHAAGGVGKSVFSRQLVTNLPSGYHGLVYDCFGSGRYRNRSETRHMHRQALVQITNELATMGLCAPMLVQQSTQEEEVMRTFLLRIESAIKALKRGTIKAKLVIVIDAADNAEMAAHEFNQSCFASELLREKLPVDFVLVAVCRTERIHLLSPLSTVLKIELQPFSNEESYQYLQNYYPDATIKEAIEFHKLTNGNPRVQANSVNNNTIPLVEILMQLGPIGTKVEDQIRFQLENAINKIRDQLPPLYKPTTDAICMGLASLPPLIPLDVLAKVAKVDEQTIKSFITDIGRPIWLSESFIRFTDEPTETWFRQTFAAKKEDFEGFVKILKPLADTSSYISESLPLLLLQAEQYPELITLALSENYLPTDNPIDARNIRIYRLQFAFKAALKTKQYPDAIKIAIRAGEEMAGDHRQLEVLKSNIDILSPLFSNEKVKEIAFRGLLRSHWAGSENIFSASLLSTVAVFEPEARSYLRAAEKWIALHNDEKEKVNAFDIQNDIPDDDMLEVAFTILNLEDAGTCVRFLIKLHPVKTFFVAEMLSRRLIDQNNFSAISRLLEVGVRYPLFVLAITNQLFEVGVFPDKRITETCLLLLSFHRFNRRKGLPLQNESIMASMISFAEISFAQKLSTKYILRILKRHLPSKATESMSGVYQTAPRNIFLRAVSLKNKLLNKLEFNFEELLPERILAKDQKSTFQRDINDFKQVFGSLLPWYNLRLRILAGESSDAFVSSCFYLTVFCDNPD